jgi:hypothetical protein
VQLFTAWCFLKYAVIRSGNTGRREGSQPFHSSGARTRDAAQAEIKDENSIGGFVAGWRARFH